MKGTTGDRGCSWTREWDIRLFAPEAARVSPVRYERLEVWGERELDSQGLPPFPFTSRQRARAAEALCDGRPFFDRVSLTFFLPFRCGERRIGVVALHGVDRTLAPDEASRWLPLLQRYLEVAVAQYRERAMTASGGAPPPYVAKVSGLLPLDSGSICHCTFSSLRSCASSLPELVRMALARGAAGLEVSWLGGSGAECWFFLHLDRGGKMPPPSLLAKFLSAEAGGVKRLFLHGPWDEGGSLDLGLMAMHETIARLLGSTVCSTALLEGLLQRCGLEHGGTLPTLDELGINGRRRVVVVYSPSAPGRGDGPFSVIPVPSGEDARELFYRWVDGVPADACIGGADSAVKGLSRERLALAAMWAFVHASMLGPGNRVLFDHTTWNVWGDELSSWGDWRGAAWAYRNGLRLEGRDPLLWNSLGVAYVEAGRPSKAKVAFEKAVECDPADFMGYYNIGGIYAGRGDHEAAFAWFSKALERAPGELSVAVRYAEAAMDAGRHDLALQVLKGFGDKERVPPRVTRLLGMAAAKAGEWNTARSALKQALHTFGNDRELLLLLALSYLHHPVDRGAAVRLRERAREMDARWSIAHRELLRQVDRLLSEK